MYTILKCTKHIHERKRFYCLASLNVPNQTTESIWKQFCVDKKWFEDKLTICSTSTDWFISLQVLIVFFSVAFSIFFLQHSLIHLLCVNNQPFAHIHLLVAYDTHTLGINSSPILHFLLLILILSLSTSKFDISEWNTIKCIIHKKHHKSIQNAFYAWISLSCRISGFNSRTTFLSPVTSSRANGKCSFPFRHLSQTTNR